jgi:hypothetical protein
MNTYRFRRQPIVEFIANDDFARGVPDIVDMPNQNIDLLWQILQQTNGMLSMRARRNEFATLSDVEVQQVQKLYADSWKHASGF